MAAVWALEAEARDLASAAAEVQAQALAPAAVVVEEQAPAAQDLVQVQAEQLSGMARREPPQVRVEAAGAAARGLAVVAREVVAREQVAVAQERVLVPEMPADQVVRSSDQLPPNRLPPENG